MALSGSLQSALSAVVEESRIEWDASLASRTTYRIGGPADALVTLLDTAELARVLAWCRQEAVPWKVLGHGSNILAADEGFRGVVIVLDGEFKYIVRQQQKRTVDELLRVGAAVGLPRLADWCCREGCRGVEFAAAIPGTVAGAVMMNAGAWGSEIAAIVEHIELIGPDGMTIVPAGDIKFSYRCCTTMRESFLNQVIGFVQLRLNRGEPERIKEKMAALSAQRRAGQPIGLPSAGCVFKNPPGNSAGWLIEQAGLKGLRIGDAQVSEQHGNIFVNRGHARSVDMLALIRTVRDRIYAASGVSLETEIEFFPEELV